MSQDLRQDQRLEQRLEMQQRLEQRLVQIQQQKLELEQYLSFIAPFESVRDWCEEHGESRKRFFMGGFDFRYSQIPLKVAKEAGIEHSPGWFVVMEDGEPFKVIVEGILPEWTLPYVAIHERGEELSHGNHFWASKLEFSFVKKNKKETIYTDAIDSLFPGKLVDLLVPAEFDIPDEILEHAREKSADVYLAQKDRELVIANALVEEFTFHPKTSELALKYHDYNEEIGKLVNKVARDGNVLVNSSSNDDADFVGTSMRSLVNETFRSIPDAYVKVARPVLLQGYQENFRYLALQPFVKKFIPKMVHLDDAMKYKEFYLRLNGDLLDSIEAAKRGEDALLYMAPAN